MAFELSGHRGLPKPAQDLGPVRILGCAQALASCSCEHLYGAPTVTQHSPGTLGFSPDDSMCSLLP